MKYTKAFIIKLGEETNFINNNLEKVIRLLDVLDFIFNKSSFSDDVVLKGGTAINLLHTNLKRLSVDIDLDYHGTLDREKTFLDKEKIEEELDSYMNNEGYNLSPKSRGSVALFSKMYQYINASGNIDYIKIEINFMNRISIYPVAIETVNQLGKSIKIKTLSKEELYGMKICALIDRHKPRDLYDVDYLFHNFSDMNTKVLRQCIVFYLSLDGIYKINDSTYESIKLITESNIKKELQPVLNKGEWFQLKESIVFVTNKLEQLLKLNKDEELYLFEFSKGIFKPSLLFNSENAERADKHPMARWKIMNIKNNEASH